MLTDKCITSKIVLISPYSRKLNDERPNPKNYPFWNHLVDLLRKENCYIIQIGVGDEKKLNNVDEYCFNKPLKEIIPLLRKSSTWVAVDNFFQHFAWYYGKKGVVLFGQSDPNIFGHSENANLLKDKKYLRAEQFRPWWDKVEYNPNAFVSPVIVIEEVKKLL